MLGSHPLVLLLALERRGLQGVLPLRPVLHPPPLHHPRFDERALPGKPPCCISIATALQQEREAPAAPVFSRFGKRQLVSRHQEKYRRWMFSFWKTQLPSPAKVSDRDVSSCVKKLPALVMVPVEACIPPGPDWMPHCSRARSPLPTPSSSSAPPSQAVSGQGVGAHSGGASGGHQLHAAITGWPFVLQGCPHW